MDAITDIECQNSDCPWTQLLKAKIQLEICKSSGSDDVMEEHVFRARQALEEAVKIDFEVKNWLAYQITQADLHLVESNVVKAKEATPRTTDILRVFSYPPS